MAQRCEELQCSQERMATVVSQDGDISHQLKLHQSDMITLQGSYEASPVNSTQFTIRTAQGTIGPTITECTTDIELHKEGQIIPNYILLAHLPTSFNVNVLLYHCHFRIWRSFVLWPSLTGLHMKHRCSLSIITIACLLIRWQKKGVSATSSFNADLISKLQIAPITRINTGQT